MTAIADVDPTIGGSDDMLVIEAPAKINLTLEVLERLPNGYHAIRSVMATLSPLCDVVRVQASRDGCGIDIRSDSPDIPVDGDNICHRAAQRFLLETGRQAHVDIHLAKRIPVAAGLGGGSSDAAAVLLALNRRFGECLSERRLSILAAHIGKDVPFFLARTAVGLATGMGEHVQAIETNAPLHVLVVNPRIAVSTADSYAALDVHRGTNRSATGRDRAQPMIDALRAGDVQAIAEALHNDFEPVVEGTHPVLREIKRALREAGAHGALMSGSGPTMFGLFNSRHALHAAGRTLRNRFPAYSVLNDVRLP